MRKPPIAARRKPQQNRILRLPHSITADQVTQTRLETAFAAPGGFNGVGYDFSGLSFPITNVTVDPLSTLPAG
jgi:hypothetical protein